MDQYLAELSGNGATAPVERENWRDLYAALIQVYYLTPAQIDNLTMVEINLYFTDRERNKGNLTEGLIRAREYAKLTVEQQLEVARRKYGYA
jgi:parvulin-like peptidyl-prolyl isomerase